MDKLTRRIERRGAEIPPAVHLVHLNINEAATSPLPTLPLPPPARLCMHMHPARPRAAVLHVNMRLQGPSISSGLQVTSSLLNLSPVIPFECVRSL